MIATTTLTVTAKQTDHGTYYTATPTKGANEYTIRFSTVHADCNGEGWELSTRRTNLSRFAGGVHYFDSIDALEASRKSLRGVADLIAELMN